MPCRSATLSLHYLRSDPSPLSPASVPREQHRQHQDSHRLMSLRFKA